LRGLLSAGGGRGGMLCGSEDGPWPHDHRGIPNQCLAHALEHRQCCMQAAL
jgi:hypothetical protein